MARPAGRRPPDARRGVLDVAQPGSEADADATDDVRRPPGVVDVVGHQRRRQQARLGAQHVARQVGDDARVQGGVDREDRIAAGPVERVTRRLGHVRHARQSLDADVVQVGARRERQRVDGGDLLPRGARARRRSLDGRRRGLWVRRHLADVLARHPQRDPHRLRRRRRQRGELRSLSARLPEGDTAAGHGPVAAGADRRGQPDVGLEAPDVLGHGAAVLHVGVAPRRRRHDRTGAVSDGGAGVLRAAPAVADDEQWGDRDRSRRVPVPTPLRAERPPSSGAEPHVDTGMALDLEELRVLRAGGRRRRADEVTVADRGDLTVDHHLDELLVEVAAVSEGDAQAVAEDALHQRVHLR